VTTLLTLPTLQPQRMWSTALRASSAVACLSARAAGPGMLSPHGVSPRSGLSGVSGRLLHPLELKGDADAIELVVLFLRPVERPGGGLAEWRRQCRGKAVDMDPNFRPDA
jgi:hypothetical protein